MSYKTKVYIQIILSVLLLLFSVYIGIFVSLFLIILPIIIGFILMWLIDIIYNASIIKKRNEKIYRKLLEKKEKEKEFI